MLDTLETRPAWCSRGRPYNDRGPRCRYLIHRP